MGSGSGDSLSLTNEKDHHYSLNKVHVCWGVLLMAE